MSERAIKVVGAISATLAAAPGGSVNSSYGCVSLERTALGVATLVLNTAIDPTQGVITTYPPANGSIDVAPGVDEFTWTIQTYDGAGAPADGTFGIVFQLIAPGAEGPATFTNSGP